MFTGLVDDVGTITEVLDTDAGRTLRIRCRYTDLVLGESIAVNGACLTVRECGPAWFTCAAVVTTLDRTTIGAWSVGTSVNLERALRLGDRLGGHLVLGHVDAVCTVRHSAMRDDAWLVDLQLTPALSALMVPHGSLTVDGVSLTVNALLPDHGVQLSIIEYTRRHTAVNQWVLGSRVHVEADVLAKHVQRLVAPMLHSTADAASSHATHAALHSLHSLHALPT
jgi:riboflavin synthase